MTDYDVHIQDDYGAAHFPTAHVRDAICWVLTRHQIEPGTGLTLVNSSDEHVQALNKQYRGINAPTDVLSFPAAPLPEEMAEAPYLGDLIVAYPYTKRHAEEAGHNPDDEFVLLAIHGTLHLLGYDHDTPENQTAMWTEQGEALGAFGINIEVPLFTFDQGKDQG